MWLIALGGIPEDKCESELIKDVLKHVWNKLQPSFTLSLGSIEKLVGTDSTLLELRLLLDLEANDVRYIGICGMGGMGKTTISRLVYERISHTFEVSNFLADVRKYGQNGLVQLQKQLLSHILKKQNIKIWDVYSGSTMIKNCFCDKKVLLILDDVDQLNQLEMLVGKKEWFGTGSRIIVTTRDERVLLEHGIEKSYKVKGLNNNKALQLFSWNAFKKYRPEKQYLELSKCFIQYSRGLPLALKTLGSYLYKRSLDEWSSALDKLEKVPNVTIFHTLKISYDGLDEMEKRMFLDVACFHKGKEKGQVIEMLDSRGFCGSIGIQVLHEKSILTIEYGNGFEPDKVQMHDLMQEMAWEIVRQESYDDIGQRSRLWLRNDILHVLANNTGTEAIEAMVLCLPKVEEVHWNPEAFSKMSKLKVLQFDNLIISPGPKTLPNSIRILEWRCYPSKFLPPSFQPEFLTKLSLPHSEIVQLWNGVKYIGNLKSLDLSFSRNLIRTPDFTGTPNLETFNVMGCTNLVEIHPSISVLKRLKTLNLGHCGRVESFPSHEMPGGKKKKPLQVLRFGIFWRKSPEPWGVVLPSLDGLCCLERLDLSDCNLYEGAIPDGIGCLFSLRDLNLSGNNFVILPSGITRLCNLRFLNLKRCERLQELPDLPSNRWLCINADDCTCLKVVPVASELSTYLTLLSRFSSINCFGLVDNVGGINILVSILRRFLEAFYLRQFLEVPGFQFKLDIVTPGNVIPKWFNYQRVGDSIMLKVPSHLKGKNRLGIVLCAVFADEQNALLDEFNSFTILCSSSAFGSVYGPIFEVGHLVSDHIWVSYAPLSHWYYRRPILIDFEACYCGSQRKGMGPRFRRIKKCGACLVNHDIDSHKSSEAAPAPGAILKRTHEHDERLPRKRSRED
ncbi:unnamed protein product [Prunus armeniaca]